MIRCFLLLLFCLTGVSSFSAGRPLSRLGAFALASPQKNGDSVNNPFRETSLLTSAATAAAAAEPSDEKKGYRKRLDSLMGKIRAAPLALAFATFLLGYKWGSKVAASSTAANVATASVRSTARRFPLVATILFVVAIRDAWSLVPNWAKKNVPIFGRRARAAAENEDDPDDLTSFPAISIKLKTLFQRGKEKLSSGEQIKNPGLVFLALIQLMNQLKLQLGEGRDRTYEQSGTLVENPTDVLEGMDEYFEYADWAYDELPKGQTLKGNLEAKGYSLLRHEKTSLPGHVDHFVAISKERKEALISIKGTSGLEDLLTDCVGNVVEHEFKDGPFVEGGREKITCHEGILLSSKRLADDLLTFVESILLPCGYKITVTGHSLGAGTAVIFSMILRSRIEELREGGADRLRVLAFASPPILDYEASKACSPFVTTFINNSDIIPRSSLSNLVVLLHIMKFVSQRLNDEGLTPRDMKSTAAFLKWLVKGKHEEMILKPEQIRDTLDKALAEARVDDPDHLFVGGRVVHMFDEWTKKDYGNKSDYEDVGDDFDEKKKVPTAEKVYVGDGAATVLRLIEIDDRMMSDHMSAGYRASIRALLDKSNKLEPSSVSRSEAQTQAGDA